MKNIDNTLQVIMYPNPAHNSLNIDSFTPLTACEISDISGKLLSHQVYASSQASLHLNIDLMPGCYYVKLYSIKGTVVKKLLIE